MGLILGCITTKRNKLTGPFRDKYRTVCKTVSDLSGSADFSLFVFKTQIARYGKATKN